MAITAIACRHSARTLASQDFEDLLLLVGPDITTNHILQGSQPTSSQPQNLTFCRIGCASNWLINPHQRCGYSDSPFARIYFFYTAGSRNRFEGMESVWTRTQKQKTISKGYFFLMEKCFEDARQDERHVPDLLEAIMRPTDPAREELRPSSFKWINLDPKLQKSWFDPNVKSTRMGLPMDPRKSSRRPTLLCNIWPR